MGLFRRKPAVDPAQLAAVVGEVAELRSQLSTLVQRLDAGDADRREMSSAVAGLQQRVESVGAELTHQLTELSGDIDGLQRRPDPAPMLEALDRRVAATEHRVAESEHRVAATEQLAHDTEARVSDAEARVADASTRVAAVETRAADAASLAEEAGAAVDGLQTAQERLANEQARYQIAFREDLAALAERTARRS